MNKQEYNLYHRVRHWLGLRWHVFVGVSRIKYNALRDSVAFIKNFGMSNYKYRRARIKKYAKMQYNVFEPSEEQDAVYRLNLIPLLDNLYKEYEFVLQDGAELSPYAEGIIAWWINDYKETHNGEKPVLVYTDERLVNGSFRMKADFAPETLEFQNYIGENYIVKKEIKEKYRELSSYELFKKITEEDGGVLHITVPLIWKTSPVEMLDNEKPVLNIDLHPLVSIIIPNKDNVDVLETCISSILNKSTYDNYEIIIVENNSIDKRTFEYYKEIQADKRIKVIDLVTDWNYSYINNEAVKYAHGDYLLFLNNDIEVISDDFIEQMLYFLMRKNIGAVGAQLLFDDNTIQHVGVTIGIRGVAGHAFRCWDAKELGYENRIATVQNVGAVTAACMMVRKQVFYEIGGFDEKLKVAFNDVDLCMKIRKNGYRIVYTPYAKLYHYESKTRGVDTESPEKLKRFNSESMRFQKRWCKELLVGDPYYNPNLSRENDDFEVVYNMDSLPKV